MPLYPCVCYSMCLPWNELGSFSVLASNNQLMIRSRCALNSFPGLPDLKSSGESASPVER